MLPHGLRGITSAWTERDHRGSQQPGLKEALASGGWDIVGKEVGAVKGPTREYIFW